MRPGLFCNHAPPLANFLRDGCVRLDGLEWTPFHTPEQIAAHRTPYSGFAFQFHASYLGRLPGAELRLRRYHRVCEESGWVSLHLSLIPRWMVTAFTKFGLCFPIPNHQWLMDLFIQRILFLQTRAPYPIILENMGGLTGLESSFESDPETITWILSETGADFLLDLGHARIAAADRGQPVPAYLKALLLNQVREIHISGPRPSETGLNDAHQPLQAEDYQLLAACLSHTDPEMVTLKYFREDGAALADMLIRLWEMIGGKA